MSDLQVVRVRSLVHISWRFRFRIWRERRHVRKTLGPEWLEILDGINTEIERQFLGL